MDRYPARQRRYYRIPRMVLPCKIGNSPSSRLIVGLTSCQRTNALEYSMTRAQYEDYKKIESDADTIFVQCSATGYLLPLVLCPLFTRRYPGYATAALLSLGCGTFGCQVTPPPEKTHFPQLPLAFGHWANAFLIAHRRQNNPLPPQKCKRNVRPPGPHQKRL